jgi:hypothetical protein
MPYEAAHAHLLLGRHLAGDARRSHLESAVEIFVRLECGRDAETARTELRAG